MINATKKWIFLKISALTMIPLMFWFIISFVSIYNGNFDDFMSFFSKQPSKFLFSLFLVIFYFFSALTISEIFEDYVHNYKIKNVANKILYLSAITIPLITITSILNL